MAEREITALKQAYGLKPSALEWLLRGKKDADVVTYCVLPSPTPSTGEKRRQQRRRTRLRSGKVLDRGNRFLVDATILDRSSGGLRLRLARDCPARSRRPRQRHAPADRRPARQVLRHAGLRRFPAGRDRPSGSRKKRADAIARPPSHRNLENFSSASGNSRGNALNRWDRSRGDGAVSSAAC